MRIMLIGGSGFLGLSIARRLRERNVEVTIVDHAYRLVRNEVALVPYRVAEYGPDLSTLDFANQDVLVYLASATLPSTSMASIVRDAEANILPAVNAFEMARNGGVRRIVFASSGGTVYGVADKLPIDEAHQTRPISAYGVSKLSIERYLGVMSRDGSIEGVSLRVANPYGPYQFRGVGVGAVARFLECAGKGEPIHIWGDGTVVRDYIYVDDVAEAFATACLEASMRSGEYNIGTGEGFSLNAVIQYIRDLCGVSVPVKYSHSRAFDVPEVVLDCGKFSAHVGWRASVSFLDGLQRMWRSIQER